MRFRLRESQKLRINSDRVTAPERMMGVSGVLADEGPSDEGAEGHFEQHDEADFGRLQEAAGIVEEEVVRRRDGEAGQRGVEAVEERDGGEIGERQREKGHEEAAVEEGADGGR